MKLYRRIHIAVTLLMTMLITTVNAAAAYIDVSATTYLIQIIAGVVIAAGTVIGVVISGAKKKAKERFNIDLDKKEREDDIVVYDNDENKE